MKKLQTIVCFALCAVVVAATLILAFVKKSAAAGDEDKLIVLNIWQIDSFEGGTGSRAGYLQKIADAYSEQSGIYAKVVQLEHASALANLENGIIPDIISYGAGAYGLESYIPNGYACWCYGAYCILTLDVNSDFSDVTAENTVINAGKSNFSKIAAMLFGIGGAASLAPTSAYIQLIGGKYKYLLGTQRDIYRLKTRETPFGVKPITAFNDLYQMISVTAVSPARANAANGWIAFLMEKSENLQSVGMLSPKGKIYDNELRALEGLDFEYKLSSPVSQSTYRLLQSYEKENRPDQIKMLLK